MLPIAATKLELSGRSSSAVYTATNRVRSTVSPTRVRVPRTNNRLQSRCYRQRTYHPRGSHEQRVPSDRQHGFCPVDCASSGSSAVKYPDPSPTAGAGGAPREVWCGHWLGGLSGMAVVDSQAGKRHAGGNEFENSCRDLVGRRGS
jgi:hypothetical protein